MRQLFLVFLAHILGIQDTGLKVATGRDDPESKPRQSEKREGKLPNSFYQATITQRRRKDEEEGGKGGGRGNSSSRRKNLGVKLKTTGLYHSGLWM